MLNDKEHFQEFMRERLRLFEQQQREQDFSLVIELQFLAKFPNVERRLGRPAIALVSEDSTWTTLDSVHLVLTLTPNSHFPQVNVAPVQAAYNLGLYLQNIGPPSLGLPRLSLLDHATLERHHVKSIVCYIISKEVPWQCYLWVETLLEGIYAHEAKVGPSSQGSL